MVCGKWAARPTAALRVAAVLSAMFWLAAAATPDFRASATEGDTVVRFEQAANNWYDVVRSRERERALAQARLVRLLAAEVRVERPNLSTAMDAVDKAIDRGERALKAGADAQEALSAAASVRLAADAVAGHRVPLWKQYIRPVRGELDRLADAVHDADRTSAFRAVVRLAAIVRLLEPALLAAGTEPEMMAYIRGLLAGLDRKLADGAALLQDVDRDAAELRKAVLVVFGEEDDRDAFAPPSISDGEATNIIGAASIFAAILAALAYTAYRMYRGGQEVVPVRGKGADRNG